MIKVWATYRNADMTEGRGPMILDKVFMEKDDANTYLLQQEGVMGRKPEDEYGWRRMGDWQVKPLFVMEHLSDGEEYERQQILQSAYTKLSKAERAALEEEARKSV
jgi:hypothetical protein